MKNRFFYRLLYQTRPAYLASFFKRLCGIHRQSLQVDGMAFWVDPVSNFGQSLLVNGGYEPELTGMVRSVLHEGGTFVDVGANEGWFTVVAGRAVGPKGRVLALEPQSRLQEVIRRNCESNQIHNVTLFRTAVGSQTGTCPIYLTPDVNTGASGMQASTKYKLPTEETPISPLSVLFERAGIDHVDCLKMDIEGFEWDVIHGAEEIFSNHRVRHICMEVHPTILRTRGFDVQNLISKMRKWGYRIEDHGKHLRCSVID